MGKQTYCHTKGVGVNFNLIQMQKCYLGLFQVTGESRVYRQRMLYYPSRASPILCSYICIKRVIHH